MEAKDTFFSTKKTLNIQGRILDLSTPIVMGILNITPDSFYDGGKHLTEKQIVDQAQKMLQDGATIIDVGGYSSRPGASEVSESEEINRICNAINLIIKEIPEAVISVDTFRSSVASAAIEKGAKIINDISGGELDKDMFDVVAESKAPYIMMHMRGTPQTMSKLTTYQNIIFEMIDYFSVKIKKLIELGVCDIIIDPGFGFAKTREQNFEILHKLQSFQVLGLPLLAGMSRKSMIQKTLEVDSENSLNGTSVVNTMALMNGANILRVHDVKEAVECIKLYKATYP